jgi:2,3-dihydroxy-p-cumate/2,3-dihydroxybenzoate 3,4-dioxygenase
MSHNNAAPIPFRYRKPGYVALAVTDLDRSIAFYRDLVGLTLQEREGDQIAFLRCGTDHHDVVLYKADQPGLKRMAFQLESPQDLELAHGWLTELGYQPVWAAPQECATLRQGPTLRFRIPDCDLLFEFYAQMESCDGWQPTVAKIERLGHVVVGMRNPEAVLATLLDKLNFRLSDQYGTHTWFLRCFPNPYHHSFAVARAKFDRLHHVNFMVTDVDDVGRAIYRMRKAGVEIVFGPGRHDISNSIFLYFLDPDGMTVEYSFGMEEFAEDGAREARQLPFSMEILDSWGGAPLPATGKGGAVEASQP